MKKVKILVCLALVLSLTLCLAACGKDSSSGSNSIAGKYNFVSMEMGGEKITAADLAALGGEVEMYVRLDGDGTGIMYSEGTTEDIVYADGKIWPVSEPEEKADFTVKGNTLTITEDDTTMTFKK